MIIQYRTNYILTEIVTCGFMIARVSAGMYRYIDIRLESTFWRYIRWFREANTDYLWYVTVQCKSTHTDAFPSVFVIPLILFCIDPRIIDIVLYLIIIDDNLWKHHCRFCYLSMWIDVPVHRPNYAAKLRIAVHNNNYSVNGICRATNWTH